MEIHLKIIGLLLLLLAAVHVVFPRYFRWREELPALSLINRQMMTIHTFFLALVVGLMGLLCWTSAPELVSTPLGRRLCLGLGVFWGIRLIVQFVGYSSELWRGKAFETVVHVVFIILWTYLAGVFGWVSLG
jgi:hypothetical protein